MNKRNVKGQIAVDTALIANNEYNEASGARKQIDVGPKLLPLDVGTATPTTNATVLKALPSMGRSIAVYNNGALASITFGVAGQASLAPGVVDAVTKAVGIPCQPNTWTYLSAGSATHVIASAATLLVFLIDDQSLLIKQS